MLLYILFIVLVSGCTNTYTGEMTSADVFPEIVYATVRDIIDGDTIDVDLNATDYKTNRSIRLPEYKNTGHARIRLLGINAPEKRPKGEIVCSDIDVYKVDGKYADMSRENLLYLNDKDVVLKIDKKNMFDVHGRILAVVEYGGEDICLKQIKDGLACGYYRGHNKYVNILLYRNATLKAKNEGINLWKTTKPHNEFKIHIDSTPSNAKLFIDGKSIHHNTPSDEKELEDIVDMLSPGIHIFTAMKGDMVGSKTVNISNGENDILIELKPVKNRKTKSNVCVERWRCSEWGQCDNGLQTRACVDENKCGSNKNTPEEVRTCRSGREQAMFINEIMYNSLSNYDQHGEFIELYNNGTKSIDLSGWRISDSAKTDVLDGFSDSTTIVQPHGFAVITGDHTDVEVNATHLTTGHAIICSHGLRNNGETIQLFDADGNLVDEVNYGDFELCDEGYSIERKNNSWVCGSVKGSPGF